MKNEFSTRAILHCILYLVCHCTVSVRFMSPVCLTEIIYYDRFKFKTQGLMKNARDAIKLKRLDAGELEWRKQIAACTIQLAWRKYFRRKLLRALNKTNNAVMHMWDPEMLAFRQRSLVEQIYSKLYLKGYSVFKNPFSKLSLCGFNIMFDRIGVHIPNIGSLAHS